ncbi:hypothetical protein [Yersinia enterocolitica]|uniref:hypothetical protein n=1 Tax=Yersinia enterocolitica TaxID=630 RepID=UPI001C60C07C|nr:hypothetical protein [Yersinia enterocolitica]MBW5819573.1 hypothetical protein [Yersinia enterocolitica]
MFQNQANTNIHRKEYAGFFTEDSINNLDDVINIIGVLSKLFGCVDDDPIITIQGWEMASLVNLLHQELQMVRSGLHFSGGIFSWHKAEMAGIAGKQETTSN